MSTPYSKVFASFLSLIEDKTIADLLTDNEVDELLITFLNGSVSLYFKNCKKNLKDRDDSLKQFNENLDDEEIWIIAHSMLIIWISSKLYSVEKLKERLSTKDFNSLHSPSALLEKLNELKKDSLKQIKSLTISYSFNGFSGFN